jgi:hypothetical protein
MNPSELPCDGDQLEVMGRLKPGVSMARQARVQTICARSLDHPKENSTPIIAPPRNTR